MIVCMLAAVSHWAVPAMSEVMRLPDAVPDDGIKGGTVTIVAAKDEYEPGSFVVRADEDLGKVEFLLSEFRNEAGIVFPAEALDLKLVKVWYQNRNSWFSYFGDTGFKLCPELLVNDEDLIRVDEEETANYARITGADGKAHERWINAPRQMAKWINGKKWRRSNCFDCGFQPMKPGFDDAESLQPVSLDADKSRQFFITAHVAKDQSAGLYRGKVAMNRVSDGSFVGEIPVAVRVLPFELPVPCTYADPSRPMIVTASHYLSMREILKYNGGDRALGVKQLESIFRNLVRHGQTMHFLKTEFNDRDGESLMTLGLMKKVGMRTDMVRIGMYKPKRHNFQMEPLRADAKRLMSQFENVLGHRNVYLRYGDETYGSWFEKHHNYFEAYNDEGFLFHLHGEGHFMYRGVEFVTWAGIANHPEDPNPTVRWNAITDGLVGWYSKMHVGPENPAFNRRQYGMASYLSGYSAICNYAHHLGPYNDAQVTYRPMTFFYGVHGGVIDTIQWEGFREGIDDMRYATLMMRLARCAEKSGVPSVERMGRSAIRLLQSFKSDSGDMAALRLEMVERIMALREKVGDMPQDAPFKSIAANADELIAKYRVDAPYRSDVNLSPETMRETVRIALEGGCADVADAKVRIEKLDEAGCCANWLGDENAVRRLWAMRESVARPKPRRVMEVPYSEVRVTGPDSWKLLSVKPSGQIVDRAYGGSLDFLKTDVGTGDRGVVAASTASASSEEKARFYAVCDDWGLHLKFVERLPNARAVELGVEKGGSWEMYLAPGADAPHAAFIVDVAPTIRATSVYNTQYETFGVRRVRKDPRYYRAQAVFGDDAVEMHVSVAWENYAGRLPVDGTEWEFEALRWGGPNGKSAWNGTESIHGRSTWGRLKFSFPSSARCAIRRRQINLAASEYRREKLIELQYNGVFSWWRDPYVGDAPFYEKCLAPLVNRLDSLSDRAKPQMTDAEVDAFSDDDLSALVNVKFEVARRRHRWLEERIVRRK